jgi:hypothetical protein
MTSKKKDQTVLWWVGWITLTILTFFASSYFWTGFISMHVGDMDQKGVPLLWVACVFGTWMILLVPLIVLMYNKVDRVYEEARIHRETTALDARRAVSGVKFIAIPESERLLNDVLVKKIKKMPWTIKRGHLVTVTLKNSRHIDNVFVLDRQEVVGVYGYDNAPFRIEDIVDVIATGKDSLPNFETDKWLRFDG